MSESHLLHTLTDLSVGRSKPLLLIEDAAEMPVQSSGVLFVAPSDFRRNSVFFGFQIELNQLHKKLTADEKRNVGTRAVLVHGASGSGKSHLVREYVWRHKDDYPGGVFWIDARSEELLFQCFWDIAQSAALTTEPSALVDGWNSFDRFIPAVKRWLEGRDNWLLVFDNVSLDSEDQLASFQSFLPDCLGGNIIYTSVNRTLARKQRLLHPSDVKVHPLSVEDARQLLYEGLNIEDPTPQQQKKATEVVKHLEYLPLAIHALSFKLFATGKSLEKYQIGSYKTSSRIAEPYVEIMVALWENSHVEAIHLINILSFLGHYVPVAMIHLGRKGLANFNIEVRSIDREGSTKRDLDATIATLIKYGLVERALQPYASLDQSFLSKNSNESKAEPATMNENDTSLDSSADASSQSSVGGIEILRIHTVAQSFFRDELWLKDKGKFQWYLSAAVSMFCFSYNNAATILNNEAGRGLVRDFREYECHAAKLLSHFPKNPGKASLGLRRSRHELRTVLRSIKDEIQSRSPNHSSELVRGTAQASIFDRTSSTSSNGLETPTSTPSRTSTWGFEVTNKQESPVDYKAQPGSNIEAYENDKKLQIVREDAGYMSGIDADVYDGSRRVSSDTVSDVTQPSGHLGMTSVEKAVAKPTPFIPQIFQGHITSKPHRDLGEWRPRPTQPSVTYSQARADPTIWDPSVSLAHTRSNSSGDRSGPMSAGSEAEARLAAFHSANPPAARGGRIRSTSRSRLDESVQSIVPPTNLEVQTETLHPRGLSPLAAEFRPRDEYQQDAELLVFQLPASRPESRTLSATIVPPLPVEENIALTRRVPANLAPIQLRTEASLPPNYMTTSAVLPSGYASQPMSRDNSKESHASMSTEPPLFKPTFSTQHTAARRGSSFSPHASPHLKPTRLTPVPIQGSAIRIRSVLDSSSTSPVSPPFEPCSVGSDANLLTTRPQNYNTVQFGDSEPVDLAEAKSRTEEYRRRLPFERGDFRRTGFHRARPYPTQNMIPTPSDEGLLRDMVDVREGLDLSRTIGGIQGLGIHRGRVPPRQ